MRQVKNRCSLLKENLNNILFANQTLNFKKDNGGCWRGSEIDTHSARVQTDAYFLEGNVAIWWWRFNHARAHTPYVYTYSIYTHIYYIHIYINNIFEGLVWRSTVWPCLLLQSPVPPSPSSSESIHAGFSQFFHTLHVPFCQGACTVSFFLFYLFIFLGRYSSLFWLINSSSFLRSQGKGHFLRKSSQTTTPLPLPCKSGRVPLHSAFRDCIPFRVTLSLVNHAILLCVIILFICLLLWTLSSKKAGLCSPFQPQCLKKGLICRRGSRNTWLIKQMSGEITVSFYFLLCASLSVSLYHDHVMLL